MEEKKLSLSLSIIRISDQGFFVQHDRSQVPLSGIVRTDYKVSNLKNVKNNDNNVLDIPDQAMITMLSIAISHLRALLTKNASSTLHQNLILPIVNPAEIYRHFKENPVAQG